MTFCKNKYHYSWRNIKEANFLCLCSLFTLPDCKDFGEYIYTKKINKIIFYTLGKTSVQVVL